MKTCRTRNPRKFPLWRGSLRRGCTATPTLQTTVLFRWFDPTSACTTGATCRVLFDDPSSAVRNRTISLDLS